MYVIDTERAGKPEIFEYPPDMITEDMEFFGVKNVMDLDDPDWRVFKNASDAEKWLSEYTLALKELKILKVDRALPVMRYQRRYLVQTLMGVKMSTVRPYNKGWKPGQLFNFSDQTHYVTVRLKSIKEIEPDTFEYKFELA